MVKKETRRSRFLRAGNSLRQGRRSSEQKAVIGDFLRDAMGKAVFGEPQRLVERDFDAAFPESRFELS